jgi:hypothetical protein
MAEDKGRAEGADRGAGSRRGAGGSRRRRKYAGTCVPALRADKRGCVCAHGALDDVRGLGETVAKRTDEMRRKWAGLRVGLPVRGTGSWPLGPGGCFALSPARSNPWMAQSWPQPFSGEAVASSRSGSAAAGGGGARFRPAPAAPPSSYLALQVGLQAGSAGRTRRTCGGGSPWLAGAWADVAPVSGPAEIKDVPATTSDCPPLASTTPSPSRAPASLLPCCRFPHARPLAAAAAAAAARSLRLSPVPRLCRSPQHHPLPRRRLGVWRG